MRKSLDTLYLVSGILASIAIVVLTTMVVSQILARFFNVAIVWAGDIAGYSLVAATFMALAPTFRNGVHVRVSLAFSAIPERYHRGLEIWCLALSVFLSAYFAYACVDMAWQSWEFDDRSTGLVPFELWMPQSIMALGVILFCIANIDALVGVLRGDRPFYRVAEEERAAANTSPVTAD